MNELDLTQFTPADLKELEASVKKVIAANNGILKDIQKEITSRYEDLARQAYDQANKESGSMTLPQGDFKLKTSISKSVKWDSTMLQQIAATMPWEDVSHYFKIDFKVPDSIFNAIPPGELKDKITAARTVKYGDLKLDIELVEEDAV